MSRNGGIDLIGDGPGTSFKPRLGRIRTDTTLTASSTTLWRALALLRGAPNTQEHPGGSTRADAARRSWAA